MTQEALQEPSLKNSPLNKTKRNQADAEPQLETKQASSTLIEFPGAARTVPEWRKQLSQRVREVQERKAREAAEELAAAQEAGLVSCALPSGQLELVPDLEQPVMNPIVTKALERIERARRSDFSSSRFTATATAPALAPDLDAFAEQRASAAIAEAKPKLKVVAPLPPISVPLPLDQPAPSEMEQIVVEVAAAQEAIASVTVPSAELPNIDTLDTKPAAVTAPGERRARKPVRVISENDVALSYLENCLSVPALADDSRHDVAGLMRRIIAGVFDLLLVGLMVSPVIAALHYAGANWSEPRVIGIAAGITAATMFAYFTVTTALTGRTLAMRIFSLRTIDLRTGLIPTGGQSIKRAMGHVFSLAIAGLGLAYALIDPDRRTLHDRFSQTIVIRD